MCFTLAKTPFKNITRSLGHTENSVESSLSKLLNRAISFCPNIFKWNYSDVFLPSAMESYKPIIIGFIKMNNSAHFWFFFPLWFLQAFSQNNILSLIGKQSKLRPLPKLGMCFLCFQWDYVPLFVVDNKVSS